MERRKRKGKRGTGASGSGLIKKEVAVKEIPILFCGEMIRAILSGRKTMTRRIRFKGHVGDILWVRETWTNHPDGDGILYRATDPGWDDEDTGLRWKPSIFMPRCACRIRLKVLSVKQENLQAITNAESVLEGIPILKEGWPKDNFRNLWNSLNAKRGYSWESNPVVYSILFSVIENRSAE